MIGLLVFSLLAAGPPAQAKSYLIQYQPPLNKALHYDGDRRARQVAGRL